MRKFVNECLLLLPDWLDPALTACRREGVPTFPEVFREHGSTTFGTGKWHQSRASFRRSFAEGANVFFGSMSNHFLA